MKQYYYYFESGKVAICDRPLNLYEIVDLEARYGEILSFCVE